MPRYTLVLASDERNRGNGCGNNVFIHAADDATAQAVAARLEARVNAKLVGINKQIVKNGYDNLPEGLPGDLVQILFKNPTTGATEQISWVFGNPAATDAQIKAIFTPGEGETPLQNRYGDPLGDIIKITHSPLSEE